MTFNDGSKLAISSTEFDRSNILDLIESANPEGANLVLSVDDQIDHSPGLTWEVECYWYVVETTVARDKRPSWALFTIDWDDNWGQWRRTVECGVAGDFDQEIATNMLMEKYFNDRGFNPDDDFWADLFRPFLQAAKG